MSKFRKGLLKRVMAVVLSCTMIMSGNMTAFASEAPADTGRYVEEVADENDNDDGTDGTSAERDTDESAPSEDAAAEETTKSEENASNGKDDTDNETTTNVETVAATDTEVSDEEQTSEVESDLSVGTEEEESVEVEAVGAEITDLQTMSATATYILDISSVADIASGNVKEGDIVLWGDNHFALLCGNSTQVEANKSNTFSELAYETGQIYRTTTTKRLATGGEGTTSKQSIKFTTSGPADVTVYWASKAAGRQMSILNSSGKKIAVTEAAMIANGMYASTMTLASADSYFLGGNNYICKVKVEPANEKKNLTNAEGAVIYNLATDKDNFPEMTEDKANNKYSAIEGCAVNYYGLIVDANKNAITENSDKLGSNGKWSMKNNCVQVNDNTIIYIPVEKRSRVTINASSASIKYTLDGKASTGVESTFDCNGDGGYATMNVITGNYLNSIKIAPIAQRSVTGKVNLGDGVAIPAGLEVIFTDTKDKNLVIKDTVGNDGSYSVTLYEGSTYDISLSGNYDISEPESKQITVGNSAITDFAITAASMDVNKVSCSVTFETGTAPDNFALKFKAKQGTHSATAVLESDNTYKVDLEKGGTYAISLAGNGMKDYMADPAEISADTLNQTITIKEKDKHNVSLNTESFDNKVDFSAITVTFTDIGNNNDDTDTVPYEYSCTANAGSIALRDGTYSVSINKKVEYPYQVTYPDLEVNGSGTYEYTLNFKERLVWDFTIGDPALEEGKVSEGKTDEDQLYNGLYINTKKLRDEQGNVVQENGKDVQGKFGVSISGKKVQVNKTTKVKIPVSGRGTVAIEPATGPYELKRLTDKDQDASNVPPQSPGTITYNEETKYVLMEATTGTVWLTKIAVTRDPAVEVSGRISGPDGFDISNFTVAFVNQTDDSTIPVEVNTDGSYNVKLTSGHTYVATLSGDPRYGFAEAGKTIEVEGTAPLTGKNLTVEAKSTVKYSGKITGFAEDYKRLDNLKVILTAGVDKTELIIDKTDKSNISFNAVLESGTEYTIKLEGVDDYTLTSEATIQKTSDYTADIIVGKKPTYMVSGKFLELDKAEVTKVSFTYVNEGALDKNYIYEAELNTAKDGYSVMLRDGEYEASAEVNGYTTRTHVIVTGGTVDRDLLFLWTDTSKLDYKADLYVGYDDREDSYNTVTKALKAAKRMSPSADKRITIHIAPGTYREQIIVDVPYITFKNDTPSQEVKLTWYYGIGYKYYSSNPAIGHGVDGFYDPEFAYNKKEKNTVFRWGCTVLVKATDFRAENIVFENSFNKYVTDEEIADGVEPIEQETKKPVRAKGMDVKTYAMGERAAALYIEDQGDKAEFYNCQFLSNQDTVGTGSTTPRSYFKDCLIEGNTDYICGAGDAVFDNCELRFAGYSDKSSGGYITAASVPRQYGYLFWNCTVTGTTNSGANKDIGYLGRPWNKKEDTKLATVTFVNTILDRADIIYPVGWKEMGDFEPSAVNYKEYNTTVKGGAAADISKRTPGTVVTENPVADMTVYFGDWTPAYYNHVDAPTTETKQGKVAKGTEIVLKCATQGSVIRYTTNGDAPTESSTKYEDGKPIVLDTTGEIVIKAIAFKGTAQSSVAEFTYTVVDADKFVAAPTADVEPGKVEKGRKVTLTSAAGTEIHYTTNGDVPTTESTLYKEPIVINETTTIKAIAVKDKNVSDIATFKYIVDVAVVDPVTINPPTSTLNPGIVPVGKTVTLQAENGATIYYTINGDDPTGKSGELYDGKPIALGSESKTIVIKAIAVKGEAKSKVATFTYTVSTELDPDKFVEAPVFDIPSGKEVEPGTKVTLTNPEEGVKVYYTMDGTEPTSGSTEYKAPIDLGTKAGEVVIKAIAFREENKSSVSTYEYTIVEGGIVEKDQVEAPEATPAAGEIKAGTQIKLESKTEGATIYYTIDGTEPTTESTECKEPIIINEAVTIKAFAVKEGLKPSKFVEFKYTIKDNTNTPVAPDDPGSTKPDAKDIWITGLEKSYPYTGAKIIPDIKVWDCDVKGADRLLTPGVDYTVTYKNNVKPTDDKTTKDKMPTVIVTGKGNYFGKDVTETFGIAYVAEVTDEKAISVKGAKIELVETKYAPTYDGTPKNPAFKLVVKGKTPATYEYEYNLETGKYVRLDNDKEMNVNIAVSNNVSKGTATILVSGKKEKNKVTSVKATFKILPVDLSKATVEVKAGAGVYAVKGAVPESLTVTCGGKTLVNGIDYTVKYGNNKNAGNQVGTIAITGKGNYTKKASTNVKFDIKPLDLSEISVSAVTACEGITPGKIKATVVDGDGNALKSSQYKLTIYQADKTTDYGAKDRTKLTADTEIYVEATAAEKEKNLTGTTKKECFKVGKDISKAKFKLKKGLAKEYTGAEVKLTKEDFESVTYKDKSGTSNLTLDAEYEIIEYSNNINKGTATAVIRGKGSYSGTKIIKFKIKQKKMVKGSESTTNK